MKGDAQGDLQLWAKAALVFMPIKYSVITRRFQPKTQQFSCFSVEQDETFLRQAYGDSGRPPESLLQDVASVHRTPGEPWTNSRLSSSLQVL